MMLLEFLALTAVLVIALVGTMLATALRHDAWIALPFAELPPGFEGPWIVAPHRWLAFAVMYFCGLGLYKLLRDPRRVTGAARSRANRR